MPSLIRFPANCLFVILLTQREFLAYSLVQIPSLSEGKGPSFDQGNVEGKMLDYSKI
jgi:hypothetical protein